MSPPTLTQDVGIRNAPTDHVPGQSSKDVSARTATSMSSSSEAGKTGLFTWYTIRMTMLLALGGFVFGYDTGTISGYLQMDVFRSRYGEVSHDLKKEPSGYFFTNVRSGLIVGLLSIGTLFGALLSGPLANNLGRKYCLSAFCLIFCVGVMAQISVGTGNWVGMAMGRWVGGLGIGGLSTVVPMYMAETAPVSVRGTVICCYQLFIAIGMLVACCINFGTESLTSTASYRIPMGIDFVAPVILFFGLFFLPESPRYDWCKEKFQRAQTTIAKFYGVAESNPIIENECDEMEKARVIATASKEPWWKIFTDKAMPRRLALAGALQMFQQLTGANYFFYYGTSIFAGGVGIKNPYVTAMILAVVNVISTCGGVYMNSVSPRRMSLIVGGIIQCVCFLIYASVGQFVFATSLPGSPEAKLPGIIMIVFTVLFTLSYSATWGPLVWTCIAEMFPYKHRAVAISFATASNWFWNFMLAFFTPFITAKINFAYGFIFAGCNLLAAILVYFFLIESSGRTLEEIDQLYVKGANPRGGHQSEDAETGSALSLKSTKGEEAEVVQKEQR